MERITRRRFLWMLAGAAGLGGWWFRDQISGAAPVAAPTTTSTTQPLPSASTTTTAPAPPTTAAPPVALEVIERAGWGARPATSAYGSHAVEHLTVHHTAVALDDNRRAPARLRGHQAYHQEQGWPDLAYHFAIDRDGNVYEARPFTAPGDTFTSYDPAGHFLPVLEGNFDDRQPADAQIESLVRLLAWAIAHFGVAVDEIGGHRDYAATSCPGDAVYEMIAGEAIQERVAGRLAAGGVALVMLRGEEAVARVAAIES